MTGDAGTSGNSSSSTSAGTASTSGDQSTGESTGLTIGDDTGDPTVDPDSTGTDGTGGLPSDCREAEDCENGRLCVEGICTLCTDVRDGDAQCAAALPDLPFCGGLGRCVACTDDTCSGDTPSCNQEVGCVACSEHDQCPDSACHLGGPDAGSCFDVDDVIEVQAPGAFAELLNEVGPGEDRVLILGAGTYVFPVEFQADVYDIDGQREIALLGNGSTVVEGSVGANAAFINAGKDVSQLYMSRLEWNGVPGAQPSYIPLLVVGEGAELWVDDSITRGTLHINGGTAHLRRSNVFDGVATPWGFPDASIQGSGGLFLENTSVDPGMENFRVGGQVDIRYSTIVIDGDMICGDDLGGVVRNSIVLTGGSIEESCEGAGWSGNAVNTPGFGVSVPAYMQSWFAATETARFRLSEQGTEVFGDIAEWDEGDPVLDVEGDARPTMGPSAAGVDEP